MRIDEFCLDNPGGLSNFAIKIARPVVGCEPKSMPVFFVTDGDMSFNVAARLAEYRAFIGVPTCIVVGIGYGASFADFLKLRTADLTLPLSSTGLDQIRFMTNAIGDRHGGAERFLNIIIDRLIPQVLKQCPEAAQDRHILFGHSLGGLFSAFALLTRPDAFNVYLPMSPSLWWDDFALLFKLADFSERLEALPAQPKVMIGVGSKEEDSPVELPPGIEIDLDEGRAHITRARMIRASAEFAQSLKTAGLRHVEHVVFHDEDHMSVVPAMLARGMGAALA